MNASKCQCPSMDTIHALADGRDETLTDKERATLLESIKGCPQCEKRFEEARRFRTLVLKTRVPGLNEAQREGLEARISMLSAEIAPPRPSLGAKLYWGLAAAATLTFCVIGVMELSRDKPEGVDGFLSETGRARVAGAFAPIVLSAAEGAGQLATADGKFRTLKAGVELAVGTQIRSADTPVRLVVSGNFELELGPQSLVSIEAGNGREVFVRLRRGQVDCQVSKRRYGQKFAVLAGSHRVSVIGTEFRVSYPRIGDVSVQVSEGAVRVDEATSPWQRLGDTTMVVRAGHRWRAHSGKLEMGPVEPVETVLKRDSEGENAPPPIAPSIRGQGRPAAPRSTQAQRRGASSAPAAQRGLGHSTVKTRRARARRKAKAMRGSQAKSLDKSITIEVPPQRMSDDEIRRAKELETRQSPGQ